MCHHVLARNYCINNTILMEIKEIEKTVADILNVTVDQMHTPTRRREVVWARHFVMYYCVNFYNWTYIGIAYYFKRHRTTVNYILQKVPEMIEYDKEFAAIWRKIINTLGQYGFMTKQELEELCNNVSYR